MIASHQPPVSHAQAVNSMRTDSRVNGRDNGRRIRLCGPPRNQPNLFESITVAQDLTRPAPSASSSIVNVQMIQAISSPQCTQMSEDRSMIFAEEDEDKEGQRNSSFLSIFADNAIDWVASQVGESTFMTTARRLANVMKSEKLGATMQPDRFPEPDYATALTWTAPFFDRSLDAVYGVVHRASFEAHLVEKYVKNSTTANEPVWYALRNAVFAAGCRIALSSEHSPNSFTEARTLAWRYYENALSLHIYLVYCSPGLNAIRALVLMAFFAEALGSPALEYMLMANATRLAQSKGLHLQVSQRSKMLPEEYQDRQWLWWCIYSYDKHLAYRSGRPSVS